MANFKMHLSVAAVVSSASAFTISIENLMFIPPLILSGTVGGILPDIDADNSRPLKILFLLLSIAVAVMFFMLFLKNNIKEAIISALAGAIIVNFILKPIFSKMTTHRGIFHSIPMGVLFGIGIYFISSTRFSSESSLYLGVFLTGGYLVHLLLDELYSVDLKGIRIKSSFGSALKLFSFKQVFLYIVMYIAIGSLLVKIL